MSIADRIQTLRKSKGISQEELADKIGVSRQAVSKWESGQSAPDIEKIILLSEFFGVTTDFLLKGIKPVAEETKSKPDARIFALAGTAINFIGLVVAIMIWVEEQTLGSVAVGLIIMAVGCLSFGVGQYIGTNRRASSRIFGTINVWLLSPIPCVCIYLLLYRIIDRLWWSPRFSQNGSAALGIGSCLLIYVVFCVVFDVVWLKCKKR